MITELKSSELYKYKALLHEQGQLEAKAVVKGVNPGRIFVDNVDTPASGLIWLGNNDGFFFIGNENNKAFNSELNHFIDTVIVPEARKIGMTWFEGIGDHNKWDETIKRVLENRHLGSWKQRVYTLQKDDYKDSSFEPAMEKGYHIAKISERLFENSNKEVENIDFLHSRIVESWSSINSFLNKGISYCVIYKNKIVSICFSNFAVDSMHAIAIETVEEHQGKKLAQKAALAYVKECLKNNLILYWDCMDSNKPSIAVAENIGFRNAFNYTGYEFKIG
ncbi:GNAT family N-acetyltransferase [Oceanobacillus neutriphilus]|uniref:Acetyltransferase n=1 Tax=Oceanobacillus neutriphilus TaxID=531815 RepID=A0ABQ2NQ44_9BACI|nr:GNAT family N-acetyltransferase [Oceanobacillus neutriphilus]GGP08996.1 acetyltransferase [Oceanobacillus neutriphilus]